MVQEAKMTFDMYRVILHTIELYSTWLIPGHVNCPRKETTYQECDNVKGWKTGGGCAEGGFFRYISIRIRVKQMCYPHLSPFHLYIQCRN